MINPADKRRYIPRLRPALVPGVLLVLAGMALNPFALAYYLPAGRLEGPAAVQTLIGLQVALMLAGGWLLWRGPRLPAFLGASASLLLAALVVSGLYGTARALLGSAQREQLLEQIDRGESLILWLEARALPALERSAGSGVLPDTHSYPLFAEKVQITDLAQIGERSAEAAFVRSWPLDEPRSALARDLRL